MSVDNDIYRAVQGLAGTDRVLLYDVTSADRPSRPAPASPLVIGGESWWQFVTRRKDLDDGWLNT